MERRCNGCAVTDVCWNCVVNPNKQRWVVRCNKPPLLELEKVSIYQYMRRVRQGGNSYHSEPFRPKCMECQRIATSSTKFVLVVLTTEHQVYRLSRTGTKMRDLVDVGVVCGCCAEANWGADWDRFTFEAELPAPTWLNRNIDLKA